jgi:hypothetical protein
MQEINDDHWVKPSSVKSEHHRLAAAGTIDE